MNIGHALKLHHQKPSEASEKTIREADDPWKFFPKSFLTGSGRVPLIFAKETLGMWAIWRAKETSQDAEACKGALVMVSGSLVQASWSCVHWWLEMGCTWCWRVIILWHRMHQSVPHSFFGCVMWWWWSLLIKLRSHFCKDVEFYTVNWKPFSIPERETSWPPDITTQPASYSPFPIVHEEVKIW